LAQNFSGQDTFSSVTTSWGPDVTLGNGHFVLGNGVLNFTTAASSSNEQADRFWTQNNGSYNANWSIFVDIHLDPVVPNGGFATAGFYVQNSGDVSQDFFRVALRRDDSTDRNLYMDAYANGVMVTSTFVPTTSTDISLGVQYVAATHVLTAAYDADGSANGRFFTPFASTDINATGSNWYMNPNDTFQARIFGQSTIPVSLGQVTLDNFTAGPSLLPVPEPTVFSLLAAALVVRLAVHRRWTSRLEQKLLMHK
jgi:hypothetical protein